MRASSSPLTCAAYGKKLRNHSCSRARRLVVPGEDLGGDGGRAEDMARQKSR